MNRRSVGWWLMTPGRIGGRHAFRLGRALYLSGVGHQSFVDAWRGRL